MNGISSTALSNLSSTQVGELSTAQIGALSSINFGNLATDPRYLKAQGLSNEALAGMIGLAGPYAMIPSEPYMDQIFPEAQRALADIESVLHIGPRSDLRRRHKAHLARRNSAVVDAFEGENFAALHAAGKLKICVPATPLAAGKSALTLSGGMLSGSATELLGSADTLRISAAGLDV